MDRDQAIGQGRTKCRDATEPEECVQDGADDHSEAAVEVAMTSAEYHGRASEHQHGKIMNAGARR